MPRRALPGAAVAKRLHDRHETEIARGLVCPSAASSRRNSVLRPATDEFLPTAWCTVPAMSEITPSETDQHERQAWMSVLAKAEPRSLEPLWSDLDEKPAWSCIRPPETGMVMVRARAGGTGQRFNMGEMTVTRCVVRLDSGSIGHAYIAGRNSRHAELAAVIDALMQQPERRDALRQAILDPLTAEQEASRKQTARRAAATKVDFFTMVRGE